MTGNKHGTPPYTFDHYTAHVREWEEEYRHQCEVRYLMNMKRTHGRQWVVEYLNSKPVQGRRARLVNDLNAAMAAQRKKRNTP